MTSMTAHYSNRNNVGSQSAPCILIVKLDSKASHWKFLMGAVGSQSLYIRQLGVSPLFSTTALFSSKL